MHRFFIDKAQIENGTAFLEGEDVHHIKKVLRLSVGDLLELCDGLGSDYIAEIESLQKDRLSARIKEVMPSIGEPKVRVTLYQGIPKGPKMEVIIQKCVELGIHGIVPLETVRTVVKLENQKEKEKKTARWQKIAEEAAKQSKRGMIPRVFMPESFHDGVSKARGGLKVILWEQEKDMDLKSVLKNFGAGVKEMDILIGPEGGLEEEELHLAKEHGWLPATIGPRILRTETAGLAVLSAIMFHMEEMKWS